MSNQQNCDYNQTGEFINDSSPDRAKPRYGGSQSIEIPYPLGSPQKPMPEMQHFHKFQLNVRPGDAAAQKFLGSIKNMAAGGEHSQTVDSATRNV